MNEKSYFLQLTDITKKGFDELTRFNEVKIIVPEQMPEKFHKLHTENELVFNGTNIDSDFERLNKTYKDYDVYCAFAYWCEFNDYPFCTSLHLDFMLSEQPTSSVVAFVCIPKDCKYYVKNKQNFLHDTARILTDYYNDTNFWLITVMDMHAQDLPYGSSEYYGCDVDRNSVLGDFIEPYDTEWFEACKDKYGISQQEIDNTKELIMSGGANCTDKLVYVILNDRDEKWRAIE